MIAPSSPMPAHLARPRTAGVPAHLRPNPLLGMENLALVAGTVLMLLQLRGFTLGELAALVALPILALVTFLADRRYLPTMLVLCIPSVGVLTVPKPAAFYFPEVVNRVVLAGVEFNGPLVVITFAFARVCVELLRGGGLLRGIVPRWLVWAFLLALVPAFVGGLRGQALGLNQWSVGFRAMLAVGGVFWGVLVARRSQGNPQRLLRQLTGVITVGAALLLVRFVSDMYVFLLMGMAGGLIPYFIARKRLLEAAILMGAAVMGAISISLTTFAEVLVAGGCVMLAAVSNPGLRRWMLRTSAAAGLVASATLIWLVRQLHGKTLLEIATRDDGLITYATLKLLGDRGPLWLAAIQQISAGPYWIVPSGRPLRPENFNYGYMVYFWEFGAHNTLLELTRNGGLIVGAIGIGIMVFVIFRAVRVLAETRDGALRGLAAGVVGVAVPGMTTGNFPMQDIGFFLWAMGGIVIGTHFVMKAAVAEEEEEEEDEPDAAPLRPGPPLVLAGRM